MLTFSRTVEATPTEICRYGLRMSQLLVNRKEWNAESPLAKWWDALSGDDQERIRLAVEWGARETDCPEQLDQQPEQQPEQAKNASEMIEDICREAIYKPFVDLPLEEQPEPLPVPPKEEPVPAPQKPTPKVETKGTQKGVNFQPLCSICKVQKPMRWMTKRPSDGAIICLPCRGLEKNNRKCAACNLEKPWSETQSDGRVLCGNCLPDKAQAKKVANAIGGTLAQKFYKNIWDVYKEREFKISDVMVITNSSVELISSVMLTLQSINVAVCVMKAPGSESARWHLNPLS